MSSLESVAIRMTMGSLLSNKTNLSLALECITVTRDLDAVVSLETVGGMLKDAVSWVAKKVKEFFSWIKNIIKSLFNRNK